MDLIRKLIRRPSESSSDLKNPSSRDLKRVRLSSPPSSPSSSFSALHLNNANNDDGQSQKIDRKEAEEKNELNPFLNLPDGFLEMVFLEMGLGDLARGKRICKAINHLLTTSSPLQLHHHLLSSCLFAPLTSRTTTSASHLLSLLLARLSAFRTFTPTSTFKVKLEPDEGRLYEYLEGYLLRGNGLSAPGNAQGQAHPLINAGMGFEEIGELLARFRRMPHGATVYDLTTGSSGEWEDEEDIPDQTLEEMINNGSRNVNASRSGSGRNQEDEEIVTVIEAAENDDPEMYTSRKWGSDFEVKDVAMDPGQDLFVAAEMSNEGGDRPWNLHLHFLTLSDFKPHPLCQLSSGRLDSVSTQLRREANLVIQICDDKVFIYVSRAGVSQPGDQAPRTEMVLVAFEWTTGQKLFEMMHENGPTQQVREEGWTAMEDFILISDKTFGTVNYSMRPQVAENRLMTSLDVYTLMPNSEWEEVIDDVSMEEGMKQEPSQAKMDSLRKSKYNPQAVAKFLLPNLENVAHLTVRADPPPRAFFPRHKPLPLYPLPNTGIIVISFDCEDEADGPFGRERSKLYTLFIRKETIYNHVPYIDDETGGITDGLTTQTLQTLPITIPFTQYSTECRFMSNIEAQDWVCFVYHYRFICGTGRAGIHRLGGGSKILRLMDFNQNSVAKLICERRNKIADLRECRPEEVTIDELERYDLDDEGVKLHLKPSVVVGSNVQEVRGAQVKTGQEMPYISVWDDVTRSAEGMMIDDSRIVLISERQANGQAASLEVLNF